MNWLGRIAAGIREWRTRSWTVEITMGKPVILGAARQSLLGCGDCGSNRLVEKKRCRRIDGCDSGPSLWHPPGTFRVEDEREEL